MNYQSMSKDQLIEVVANLERERKEFLDSASIGYTALVKIKHVLESAAGASLPIPPSQYLFLYSAIRHMAGTGQIQADLCNARFKTAAFGSARRG